MQCTAFVLALAALAVDFRQVDASSAIGRTKRASGSPSFLAAIRFMGRHRCSGVVIGEDLVLTAAQCVQKANIDYLEVIVGSNRDMVHPLLYVALHPQYDPWNHDYNIAIVKAKTPFQMGESVSLIRIAEGAIDKIGALDPALILEWNSKTSGVSVRNANFTGCSHQSQITSRMLCVERKGFTGDFGSPLMHAGQLHGVLTKTSGVSGAAEVGVYARAHPYAHSLLADAMLRDPVVDKVCNALKKIIQALEDMWYIPAFIVSAVKYLFNMLHCS